MPGRAVSRRIQYSLSALGAQTAHEGPTEPQTSPPPHPEGTPMSAAYCMKPASRIGKNCSDAGGRSKRRRAHVQLVALAIIRTIASLKSKVVVKSGRFRSYPISAK